MEEKYRNHVSGLYLLCPTIPPRVLSNEQWWEVIKELSGLCHTVPMLEDKFRNSSIIQLEYLITQFLQSNPPVLALRWLMSVYSLTNSYVKLSVGRLLEETMLILYRFTNTEPQNIILGKLKHHNIGIDQQLSEQIQVDINGQISTNLNSGNILDISNSQSREIQPSHVISSLYVLQTLFRLEILETKKHFPGLIRCIPQLLIHVDTSMRDAANECLISILPLGVPGYSLSDQLFNSLISGVKILLEFDDSLNLERTIQSLSMILIQQPKLANSKKQEVLELIVNMSSSLSSGQISTLKTSTLIESISCLLASSTISQLSSFNQNLQLYDSIHYIAGVSNIQFSSYGLGSYPIQGEYFRIILSSSIIRILNFHALQKLPSISQLELLWSLLLEHLQTHFIRKHVTENLQWLTNNHWVYLWTQILKKVLLISLSSIQDSLSMQNLKPEYAGMSIWSKFEQFLNPLAKISPKVTLECILDLVSSSESTNWIWKLNKEFFQLFLNWIFNVSLTENYEIFATSYLSGYISSILIHQFYFSFNDFHSNHLLIQDIELSILNYLSFNKEKLQITQIEAKSTEFYQTLIHNSHFLIGFSNSCSNPQIIIGILDHFTDYLVKSPDIQIFLEAENTNEKLFIFNNLFLLLQNLLSNILHFNQSGCIIIHSDQRFNTLASKIQLLVPIWKNILSNKIFEKIAFLIESLTESCERFQLLMENNESETWNIFDEEKENPVTLLFKDLKQWLALLWTTIESLHNYIELFEMTNQNGKSQTEMARLDKFLMKACFSIIERLLPLIPLSWTKFFPETSNNRLDSIINPELGSILSSPITSLEDFGEYIRTSSFYNDTVKTNSNFTTNSNQILENSIQTIEKFIFPYIGHQNCFSRSIHISALIISLKFSVYKQLNKSLFSYINHPPISNRSLVMLISDVASDQILMLDLKIPSEVFPHSSASDYKTSQSSYQSLTLAPNNDILSLSEYNNYVYCQNESKIPSKLGLLESMLSHSTFPSLYNQQINSSNQHLEIHFRKESAQLLSNIISESHFLDQNNSFSHDTIKTIFRILIKRSIHVYNFWSSIIPESKYYQPENSNVKVQNIFPSYNDLSPSLFIMAQKGLINSPNNISILPLLSILWFFKYISEKTINKLNILITNHESQIDKDQLKLINNSQDFLFHIFSFLIKFLFGYRYRDLKQQINYQAQENAKKLPPRVKSSIIRYYTITLLSYLLCYFHNNKSIFSHYYYAKQKLEYLISWSNYSLSRTNRSNEDSDSLTDLYFLFFILKSKLKNIDQDLSHNIGIFFKDHSNGNISEKCKFFIYCVRKGIKFQTGFIEVESTKHFEFETLSSESQLSLNNTQILDHFGEYLCFYNLRELTNIEIFNYSLELVHKYFNLFVNSSQSFEDLKQLNQISYNSFNTLICVSTSLIFHSRLHEISFIDYYDLFYIPSTCKIFFNQNGLLASFWKFVKSFYLSSELFNSSNSMEICRRNIQLYKETVENIPFLNLLGIFIINSFFVLRKTKVLEELSTQDYELLLSQDKKMITSLVDWILRNYLIFNNFSLSFLNSGLKAMKLSTINSILLEIIKYLSNELETKDFSQTISINEISNYLLDDKQSLNLSPFIQYVQLKSFHSSRKDFSIEDFNTNGFEFRIILGIRFTIILEIIERICETIQTRVIQTSTFDSHLVNEMIAYSFWNSKNENLMINNLEIPLLMEVIELIFKILSSILNFFETSIANLIYLEFCVFSRILSIIKSLILVIPLSSKIKSISENSEILEKIMTMLKSLRLKNPGNSTILSTLEFFIQIYPLLSFEFKQSIWDIVLSITREKIDQSSSEFSHSHLCLLFKLTEAANFEIQSLSQSNEQDIITVCGQTLVRMMNLQNIDQCLIRYFAYIGFFMINNIEDIHHKIKNEGIIESFKAENLQILIQKISNNNFTQEFEEAIHLIPSLVSIWNSVNYSTDFTQVITEFLVYCYSLSTIKTHLQTVLFFLETISSLKWLILDAKIAFSSLRQDLYLDFKTLSIKYFDDEICQQEKEKVNQNIRMSHHSSNFTTFVGMICLFSLEVFNIKKGLELEEDSILKGTCNKVVYLRIYQIINELITRNEFLRDDQIQLEMITSSNQNLLLIHKSISLESVKSESFVKQDINKESYELIMNNMRFLIRRRQFSLLMHTHLDWIQVEIKNSIMNFQEDDLYMDYYKHLIDMLCEILAEIHQIGIVNPIEEIQDQLIIENVIKVIFQVFKYLLYCQIYCHPSYFEIFERFNRDYCDNFENGDQVIIPDLTVIFKHNNKLEIMILNKLEEFLNNNSQYNSQVFDLLMLSLLPFKYSYNLEYGNSQNLINTRSLKSWILLRILVLNEISKKKERPFEMNESTLISKIKVFLKKYLGILNSTDKDSFFSIVLPSSTIVTWFQALFEQEGREMMKKLEFDVNDDELKETNSNFSNWINIGGFYLPKENQQISIELISKQEKPLEKRLELINNEEDELIETNIDNMKELEKEIVEILELIE